ncbi:MAG: hypothetical protein U1E12_22890 [Hydrogenophaga sp.]|uniref:hypothetical protein n=1 Tax=Hydrogenophaga sp. TaxID=1904254 RepID=UPI002AB99B8E|nr:hypothetical protein [Hydrogenophaga sp.]MDZ4104514.1 hypothetical protein [Hydrogenophaga sp.]
MLALRYAVLVALIVGTVLAAMGSIKSHGLAALAASHHLAPCCHDEPLDHAHHHDVDDVDDVGVHATAEPVHHSADHSHDKAHALPRAWGSATTPPPDWLTTVPPWIERVEASRLERPPMV